MPVSRPRWWTGRATSISLLEGYRTVELPAAVDAQGLEPFRAVMAPRVGEPTQLIPGRRRSRMKTDFARIAIVNRAEPAMRFISAVREFNRENGTALRTIALFTEPDRRAMFVREADEAYDLGSAHFVDPQDGNRKCRYLDYPGLERAFATPAPRRRGRAGASSRRMRASPRCCSGSASCSSAPRPRPFAC